MKHFNNIESAERWAWANIQGTTTVLVNGQPITFILLSSGVAYFQGLHSLDAIDSARVVW